MAAPKNAGTNVTLPATSTDMTMSEALESLNGVEQEAIENAYGMSFQALATQDPNRLGYGLVWVGLRRMDRNVTLPAVKQNITLGQLDKFFAEEDPADEIDPDDPVSESGKDAS